MFRLLDAEDACARRFSVSEVVIHEQRGSRLGQGGRDFTDVESECVNGCLVHIRYCWTDYFRIRFAFHLLKQRSTEGINWLPDCARG